MMPVITRDTLPDKKNESYKYTNLSVLLRGFTDPVQTPNFPRIYKNSDACATTFDHHTATFKINSGQKVILIDDMTGPTATDSPPWISRAINISIASNAQCLYVRMMAAQGALTDTINIHVGDGATLNVIHIQAGNTLCRTDMIIDVHARSIAQIFGIQILNQSAHGDLTTRVNHHGLSGASTQTIRNIAAGSARAVYQGKIYVAQDAQKTDARQSCKSILLSNTAEIDTKPELEIYADDVQCSHGATVGGIDADALFYAAARGIPEPVAQHMLLQSFVTLNLPDLPDDITVQIADIIDHALAEVSA